MKKSDIQSLVDILESRFLDNMQRHKNISWDTVHANLMANPKKFDALQQMEVTGGEPDVIGRDKKSDAFIFCDCTAESPSGRRSLCYDKEALEARKENKPKGSVIELVTAIGCELLTEEDYRALQLLGEFDKKTSSWIKTPDKIRKLGGALFCDRRYDQVFVYHNGAESYYAARGFRGKILV